MTIVTIETVKEQLDQLIERARASTEIAISGGTAPDGRVLVAPPTPTNLDLRKLGLGRFKGVASVSDADLVDALPEDELQLWSGACE